MSQPSLDNPRGDRRDGPARGAPPRADDVAAWEGPWQGLSVPARRACLALVGPGGEAEAPAIEPAVLAELVAAGFVEPPAPGGKPDRATPAASALGFLGRLRRLHGGSPLDAHAAAPLRDYIELASFMAVANTLRDVLRSGGVRVDGRLEDLLDNYVTDHRWPTWAVAHLKDPLAARVVEELWKEPSPVAVSALRAKFPDVEGEALRAAVASLSSALAAFMGLDRRTLEIVVGLLPAVRQDRDEAAGSRTRPPLVPVEAESLRFVGPDTSLLVDDIRAFLLEDLVEPIRIRQDDEIYQNDVPRFLDALPPLPQPIAEHLGWTDRVRLGAAVDAAIDLELIRPRAARSQPARLEVTAEGKSWIASDVEDQYRRLYKAVSAVNASPSYGGDATDRRFLVADVVAVAAKGRKASPYGYPPLTADDHRALRRSFHRAFSSLEEGVFYAIRSILDHLSFREFSPLHLGLEPNQVVVYSRGRLIPAVPRRREAASREAIGGVLAHLVLLGCFQVGGDAEGRPCLARLPRLDAYFEAESAPEGKKARAAAAGTSSAPETRVVIQPDFSVVIIGLNPAPAAELIPFCERQKGGGQGALTLKLTRDSVVRAVSAGMKPDEILGRLKRAAGHEPPANVLRQVADWAGWVRTARAAPATLIRCPDRETADRVAAALRKDAERLGDTVLALRVAKLTSPLRQKLLAQGILISNKQE
ncbi:hypothetical protein OJF2_70290 [Aquisphaera giovannonii]|uniref:Helicase XPB/Ssl2 N-terminal domain-containing protein n=1 Tax=Aquisphaera giovannonii TaxID=406548 RepID=A0A5B9WCM9_9BACT|nr:helicase-associated domain-containing protein [Aquisphaera giovannonii]QEH38428.1 hypothetical protein OJF2_70290 [Aquisphaera giovannonii]